MVNNSLSFLKGWYVMVLKNKNLKKKKKNTLLHITRSAHRSVRLELRVNLTLDLIPSSGKLSDLLFINKRDETFRTSCSDGWLGI
jgi:hypothetical protein